MKKFFFLLLLFCSAHGMQNYLNYLPTDLMAELSRFYIQTGSSREQIVNSLRNFDQNKDLNRLFNKNRITTALVHQFAQRFAKETNNDMIIAAAMIHTKGARQWLWRCNYRLEKGTWVDHCNKIIGHSIANPQLSIGLLGNSRIAADWIASKSMLKYSIQFGKAKLVKKLLELGADPNQNLSNAGQPEIITPLMVAALYCRPDNKPYLTIAQLLIAYGANPDIKNDTVDAYAMAQSYQMKELLQLFRAEPQ